MAIGAAIAASATAAVTEATGGAATAVPAPETVTAATSPRVTPPPPAPLPAAQANRATCDAWLSTGTLIADAATAQSVIPPNLTIIDPAVRSNPDWTAAVQRAGDLYGRAANTLAEGVAPGTTVTLKQTAATTVEALRLLSTTVTMFDQSNGNAYAVTKSVGSTMDVLCERLTG